MYTVENLLREMYIEGALMSKSRNIALNWNWQFTTWRYVNETSLHLELYMSQLFSRHLGAGLNLFVEEC